MTHRVITQDHLDGIFVAHNKLVITHAKTHADCLKAIVGVVGRVIRTRSKLFNCRGKRAFCRSYETKVGKEIRECLRYDTREIDRYFPKHRFHPFYMIFKRYFGKHYGDIGWQNQEYVDELNAAVDKVRAWARGEGFARRLDNMRRTERKSWSKVRRMLREQRQKYSKSLSIRLDLGYVSKHANGSFQALDISYKEAVEHRAQLVDYICDGPFKEVLTGYVWKMEYGLEKGFHLHLGLLMNGQKVCKDITIAAKVGKHWVDVITGGRGGCFNCNQKKEAYERCALGNIARDDDETWMYVDEAYRYLTKEDLFIRMKVPPKARAFGVGGIY